MHRLSAYVIVHRTQSNQTANGNRLAGERNPIGRRTESDRMADAITRGCSCLSCTIQANRTIYSSYLRSALPLARARTAPTKQTEQELHQQSLQISFHEPQPDPRPTRYHAPRSHEQPIAPINGHNLLATLHRIHDVRSHMLR